MTFDVFCACAEFRDLLVEHRQRKPELYDLIGGQGVFLAVPNAKRSLDLRRYGVLHPKSRLLDGRVQISSDSYQRRNY